MEHLLAQLVILVDPTAELAVERAVLLALRRELPASRGAAGLWSACGRGVDAWPAEISASSRLSRALSCSLSAAAAFADSSSFRSRCDASACGTWRRLAVCRHARIHQMPSDAAQNGCSRACDESSSSACSRRTSEKYTRACHKDCDVTTTDAAAMHRARRAPASVARAAWPACSTRSGPQSRDLATQGRARDRAPGPERDVPISRPDSIGIARRACVVDGAWSFCIARLELHHQPRLRGAHASAAAAMHVQQSDLRGCAEAASRRRALPLLLRARGGGARSDGVGLRLGELALQRRDLHVADCRCMRTHREHAWEA